MNYWKKFAEMLGLELEEKFRITDGEGNDVDYYVYKLSEDGLFYKSKISENWYSQPAETIKRLLDDATGYGDVICPLEYLGRCACITTDNGFECPDDTNANWAYAIKEKIKEKIGTDEVNHEQVQGSIEQY